MKCPRRDESTGGSDVFKLPAEDTYKDGRCSWCGSISPEAFFEAIEKGEKITPTDKNYKVYVNDTKKFYFQHLDVEQQKRFIDLINAGKIHIGVPGHFYVLPFFCKSEVPA